MLKHRFGYNPQVSYLGIIIYSYSVEVCTGESTGTVYCHAIEEPLIAISIISYIIKEQYITRKSKALYLCMETISWSIIMRCMGVAMVDCTCLHCICGVMPTNFNLWIKNKLLYTRLSRFLYRTFKWKTPIHNKGTRLKHGWFHLQNTPLGCWFVRLLGIFQLFVLLSTECTD